jgi:excisionase family DNA binding protein
VSLPSAPDPHRFPSPPPRTEGVGPRPAQITKTLRRVAGGRPLLSVDEAAVLLGCNRSSVYRSIGRGDFPLPVFRINGRLRITRASVERLIAGGAPPVG